MTGLDGVAVGGQDLVPPRVVRGQAGRVGLVEPPVGQLVLGWWNAALRGGLVTGSHGHRGDLSAGVVVPTRRRECRAGRHGGVDVVLRG